MDVPRPSGRPAVPSALPLSTFPPLTTFLPLTLSTLYAGASDGAAIAPLADRAEAAERGAAESWLALLGGCACARRQLFAEQLRELSDAALAATDGARRPGSRRRSRVIELECWVTEALAEGDGKEFAEACAGYDAALAGALVSLSGSPAVAAG